MEGFCKASHNYTCVCVQSVKFTINKRDNTWIKSKELKCQFCILLIGYWNFSLLMAKRFGKIVFLKHREKAWGLLHLYCTML